MSGDQLLEARSPAPAEHAIATTYTDCPRWAIRNLLDARVRADADRLRRVRGRHDRRRARVALEWRPPRLVLFAMDSFFHDGQRKLQDAFETRRIADRLEEVNLRSSFGEADREFIQRSAFFFLATADAQGRPGVSYKGGAAGFVRVVGPAELAFPDYDGNGMFMSLGNVLVNPHVGMLFIDFETPRRLVVRGVASISREDPLMPLTVGAQLIVRVQAQAIYPNCPRYIHRMNMVEPSPYVPRGDTEPVEPGWKALPQFRDYVHVRQPVASTEPSEPCAPTVSESEAD